MLLLSHTHTQSGAWISVLKPVPSSMVMTPMPWSHTPAPLQVQSLSSKSEEERVSVEERSYLRMKEKCNLPLPVSVLLSFLYIFQKYSPVPRKNSITTTAHRMPSRDHNALFLWTCFPHTENGEWLEDRILNNHCHSEIETQGEVWSPGPEVEECSRFIHNWTEKIPKSRSQRHWSSMEVYILYACLQGGPSRGGDA